MPVDLKLVADIMDACLHTSSRRTARFLGVNQRPVQRWVSQEDPAEMPAEFREKIHEQAVKMRQGRFEGRIEEIVDEMLEAGVDPIIIQGMMMNFHDRFGSDQ